MASKVQLTGGAFQDPEGNLLANGYLEMELSQDASVSGVGYICAGVKIRIQLDSNANVASSSSTPAAPNQYVWGNDVMLPINTFYKVSGFTVAGQPAFGPNNQQVAGTGTFDVGTWVPNAVIEWFPNLVQPLTLKVDGELASSQTLQNLYSSDDSVTITDEGSGNINFQVSGGGTEFDIAGEGWFFGGQSYNDISTAAGSAIELDGTVAVVQLVLESKWVISSAAAFTITGSGAGEFATAGIYSADGNTKLVDCGAAAFDMSTHSQFTSKVTFSPVTLEPGVYWFAWSSTSSSSGAMLVHSANSALSGLLNNWSFPWLSTVPPVRFGTAANVLSAGVLPATLGTISPFEYGTEVPVLAVMFQV